MKLALKRNDQQEHQTLLTLITDTSNTDPGVIHYIYWRLPWARIQIRGPPIFHMTTNSGST